MDLALAILFAIVHYPGSYFLLIAGSIIFIAYLPLQYKVHKIKHPEDSALNKIMLSLIILVLVLAYGTRDMSNRVFESLTNSDIQVNAQIAAKDSAMVSVMKTFESNAAQFPSQFHGNYQKAARIQYLSDSLVEFLNTCKTEVAALCNADATLKDLCNTDRVFEPTNYFLGSGPDDPEAKAYEIRKRFDAMNDSLMTIIKPDSGVIISLPVVMTTVKDKDSGEDLTWESNLFCHTMLITDIHYIDQLILSVRQTEEEVISNLLSESRSSAMWNFWNKYKELRPNVQSE
jgi:hypothetical protein